MSLTVSIFVNIRLSLKVPCKHPRPNSYENIFIKKITKENKAPIIKYQVKACHSSLIIRNDSIVQFIYQSCLLKSYNLQLERDTMPPLQKRKEWREMILVELQVKFNPNSNQLNMLNTRLNIITRTLMLTSFGCRLWRTAKGIKYYYYPPTLYMLLLL